MPRDKNSRNQDVSLVRSLKCVCCGTFENIEKYEKTISTKVDAGSMGAIRRTTHASKTYNIPLCTPCKEGVTRYRRIVFRVIIGFWLVFIVPLIIVFTPFFHIPQSFSILFLFYFLTPLIIIGLILAIKYSFSKYRLSRYTVVSWRKLKILEPTLKKYLHFNDWAEYTIAEKQGTPISAELEARLAKTSPNLILFLIVGYISYVVGVICVSVISSTYSNTTGGVLLLGSFSSRFSLLIIGGILSILGTILVRKIIYIASTNTKDWFLRILVPTFLTGGIILCILPIISIIFDFVGLLSESYYLSFYVLDGTLSGVVFGCGVVNLFQVNNYRQTSKTISTTSDLDFKEDELRILFKHEARLGENLDISAFSRADLYKYGNLTLTNEGLYFEGGYKQMAPGLVYDDRGFLLEVPIPLIKNIQGRKWKLLVHYAVIELHNGSFINVVMADEESLLGRAHVKDLVKAFKNFRKVVKYCTQCGAILSKNFEFCGNCGANQT